jgi:hypothetical protein
MCKPVRESWVKCIAECKSKLIVRAKAQESYAFCALSEEAKNLLKSKPRYKEILPCVVDVEELGLVTVVDICRGWTKSDVLIKIVW